MQHENSPKIFSGVSRSHLIIGGAIAAVGIGTMVALGSWQRRYRREETKQRSDGLHL